MGISKGALLLFAVVSTTGLSAVFYGSDFYPPTGGSYGSNMYYGNTVQTYYGNYPTYYYPSSYGFAGTYYPTTYYAYSTYYGCNCYAANGYGTYYAYAYPTYYGFYGNAFYPPYG